MKLNHWYAVAALSCGLSVAFGAFGAHALKNVLEEHALQTWNTGVKYMMFHSIALFIAVFSMYLTPQEKLP
ncbi:MAG: DUF423 domain-containing protein, partial [Nitrospinae bacterium]|nr:DUF423 domain-containing protein [Nitrospinota bacterium]